MAVKISATYLSTNILFTLLNILPPDIKHARAKFEAAFRSLS